MYCTMDTAAGTSACTSSASRSSGNVVSQILLGLQAMQSELVSVRQSQDDAALLARQNQEELQSVRQGQDETAQMVRESQIESARILAKGKKPVYTFKKKGNEIQSAFIDRVTERVVSTAACVERATAADESGAVQLTKAKEDLEEGIKILTHRQKMIKFVDRSDAGWAVVKKYEDDASASNSEDERRMEKAEWAAEKEVARKRKFRESKMREEAVKKGALRPSSEPGMAFAPTKPPLAPKLIGGMVPRPSGSCFHCGEPGHFRRECPKALAKRAVSF